MSSVSISKIHVNNATRMSLNDRFTAFAERPTIQHNRSRSRSREPPRVDPHVSSKNRHFLLELERKHKMRAALKLKRRSMRTAGNNGGNTLKRGSIKAMRLSPSGKPMKTNSLTRIATMKADLVAANNGAGGRYRRPSALRRSMSSSSIAGRLGNGRPVVGGAAERVARRKMARGRGRPGLDAAFTQRRRSRSRARSVEPRGNGNMRRPSRSRSRSRARVNPVQRKSLPIAARLGVKPGATKGPQRNADRRARDRRQTGRGVATGRVEKPRRNNARNNTAKTVAARGGGANGRQPIRARGRSRSRTLNTRKAPAPAQQQKRQGGPANQNRRRGRSLQRNSRGNAPTAGGNKARVNNGMRNGRKPQNRGRSRSRGGRSEGNRKTQINKDELDKELDQYMATTKTENDMDYLLKN